MDLAAFGDELAGFAGVGEEGDRGFGADEDEVLGFAELPLSLLGEVAEAVDGGEGGAAFEAGGEGLDEELGVGGGGDPAGGEEAGFAGGAVAKEQRDGFAGAQDVGDLANALVVDLLGGGGGDGGGGGASVGPGDVGG